MASNNYFYTSNGSTVLGPEALPTIQQMLHSGLLTGDVQVAREGTQEWIPIRAALGGAAHSINATQGPLSYRSLETNELRTPIAGSKSDVTPILLSLILFVMTIGIGIFSWSFFGPRPPKTAPAIVKWEYKRLLFPAINPKAPELSGPGRTDSDGMAVTTIKLDEQKLTTLGNEGWELVTSYLEMETAFPNFGKDEYITGLRENVRPQLLMCIFKRPLYE